MTYDPGFVWPVAIAGVLMVVLTIWADNLKNQEREAHLAQMAELVRAECGVDR